MNINVPSDKVDGPAETECLAILGTNEHMEHACIFLLVTFILLGYIKQHCHYYTDQFPAAVTNTGMDDRLRSGKQRSISPSQAGHFNLLPSGRRERSTGQGAVMLCSWGVKAGMVHSTCG